VVEVVKVDVELVDVVEVVVVVLDVVVDADVDVKDAVLVLELVLDNVKEKVVVEVQVEIVSEVDDNDVDVEDLVLVLTLVLEDVEEDVVVDVGDVVQGADHLLVTFTQQGVPDPEGLLERPDGALVPAQLAERDAAVVPGVGHLELIPGATRVGDLRCKQRRRGSSARRI